MDSAQLGQMRPVVGTALIQVRMCYSCNGQHDALDCEAYHRPNPPFTHWYTCPVTRDPVPVTLVACNNVQHELHNRVMQDVFERQGQPCLFATFYVNREGGVTVNTHTVDWPHTKLAETLEAMRKNIESRQPAALNFGPLPAVAPDRLAMFKGLQSVTQVVGPVMVGEAATAEQADELTTDIEESDEQR